jgi:FkbM family methyltransferase
MIKKFKLPTNKIIDPEREYFTNKASTRWENKGRLNVISKCNQKNSVIDIGAHVGITTVHWLESGFKHVYAFEINPSHFDCLIENTNEYKDKITYFNYGCGNENKSTLTNELLSETLIEWRQVYIYEIDGVIVANDALYERKSGNPEHAFAFKMVLSDQVAEAKVVDVIWAASKDGYLKPRVQIEPINLGGVQITYATGFNGAFINDNKIGIGAIIELIRSGDVIPYIRKVVVPAQEPRMPSIPFKWNDTHVDIMLEDFESDETVREKNITGFFRGIGVEGLSTGNIKRIMETGYDSVPKIIKMTIANFLQVDGFKEKTATKLYDGIREKIEEASLTTIMSASNMLGRGFSEKKIDIIMESYPQVLLSKETHAQKIAKISAIKGMATKSAESFVERIPEFINFIKEAGLVKKLAEGIHEKKEVDQSNPLFGKSIVMTGFRDTSLQEAIKNVGAKLGSSVSSKTFVVLVKDKEEDTGKANEARKLSVPLMTPEEFTIKYL